MKRAAKAGAGNGARARRFHIGHLWRAVPDLVRCPTLATSMFQRTILLFGLIVAGCSTTQQKVDFVYFNLSDHEIQVTDVRGLPRAATPGVLNPVPDDFDSLNEVSATFFESVRIGSTIQVVWQEGGSSRRFEATRKELSIPSRLNGGRLRFTYLGNGMWHIRFIVRNL